LKVASKVLGSKENEFLIKTKNENVVGKVYISDDTRELFSRNPQLPRTQRGIDKLLKRACDVAKIPQINQHLLRKLWRTTAINLGIQETIIRILSFLAVPQATLTYFLDRTELRDSWLKVVNAPPLESKANGRISNIEETVEIMGEAFKEMVKPIVRKILLQRSMNKGGDTLGLIRMPDLDSMSLKDVLKLYLSLTRVD